jgi:starch synthase
LPVHVLLVASEALPLAKTGGLGDMVSAYAAALRDSGVEATILLPGYPDALEKAAGLKQVGVLKGLPAGDATLLRGHMPDTEVPVLLLQMEAFNRPSPYQDEHGNDFADNSERFASLSHAAVRVAQGMPGCAKPDVVHAHDWHAGLTPLLMKIAGVTARSVFTIHNLAFQGNYPLHRAARLGVGAEWLTVDGIEFYGNFSLMKAAIQFADRVTTVSETYSREILTPRFGHLMEGVLQANRHKLTGITNGIDMDAWNPASDPLISRNYSADDLRGKHACKRELQRLFGLPADPFVPVLAMCNRLTTQKMADVALQAMPMMLAQHPRLQIVVLGKGDHGLEAGFRQLAQRYPDRVGVHAGYDERRAHVLQGGSDILLHGSRFEPCGLTQIYAMRYGTLPVASRVGGLADTIVDPLDESGAERAALGIAMREAFAEGTNDIAFAPPRPATGFLFDGDAPHQMAEAVTRAIEAFMRPSAWRLMQRNAMRRDFGWGAPVAKYVAIYQELTEAAQAGKSKVQRVRAAQPAARAVRQAQPAVAPAKKTA